MIKTTTCTIGMVLVIITAGVPTLGAEDLGIVPEVKSGSDLKVRIERGVHGEERIPVVIKNLGDEDVDDIHWFTYTIPVSGVILFREAHNSGIVEIPAGSEVTTYHKVWGFGSILITAIADDAMDSARGFMFLYPVRVPPDAIWVWNCVIFVL
jgi:hypothetical protein